jgi:hypothetical protein
MQPSPRTPSDSPLDTMLRPGESIGSRNALTPRPRTPGCVAANSSTTSAASAFATHTLRPLIT